MRGEIPEKAKIVKARIAARKAKEEKARFEDDRCGYCGGRGTERLPPGTYGIITCSGCGGTGKSFEARVRDRPQIPLTEAEKEISRKILGAKE